MKKFYFNEVTYNGKPLVWELQEKDSATSTMIFDTASNTTSPILSVDEKSIEFNFDPSLSTDHQLLSFKENKYIIIRSNQLIINHLEKFKEEFNLQPNEYKEKPKAKESRTNSKFFQQMGTNRQIKLSPRNSRSTSITMPYELKKIEDTAHSPTLSTSVGSYETKEKIQTSMNEGFEKLTLDLTTMLMKDRNLMGSTIAHDVLLKKNKNNLEQQKKIPIVSANQLYTIKVLENITIISERMAERLAILNEIVNQYFNFVINNISIDEDDYKVLYLYILNATRETFDNKGLDVSLDHELFYEGQNISELSVEHQNRYRISENLEKSRAKVIARHFAIENLPSFLKDNLSKLPEVSDYDRMYQRLYKNIMQTGKHLRDNKSNNETLKNDLNDPDYNDPEYISISSILNEIIPNNFVKNSTFSLKKIPSYQSTLPQRDGLVTKIKEALVKVYTHYKEHESKNTAQALYLKMNSDIKIDPTSNEKIFVRTEYVNDVKDLLKKIIKLDSEDVKHLIKNIENCKVNDLKHAFKEWIGKTFEKEAININSLKV